MTNTETYLERIDRSKNMARYYRLSVAKTLFGEWAMVREWGRIGRGGQSREHWCSSEADAMNLLTSKHAERVRRGYLASQDQRQSAGTIAPTDEEVISRSQTHRRHAKSQ